MTRFLTLLLLSCLMWASSMAQPITFDSKCGEAATGRRQDTGVLVTLDAAGAQYLRVGPDGYWRFCEATETKRDPAGCVVPRGNVWTVGQHRCSSPNGGMTIGHGQVGPGIVAVGRTAGVLVLQCVDGKLSTRLSTCSPIQSCDGKHTITETGGKTSYVWSGSIPIGARDVAASDDGDTRPVECLPNGTMRLL